MAFNTSATIKVEFPAGFPSGLGGLVGCKIPKLQKANNDPIQCQTDGYSVTLTNQNNYDPTKITDGFTIILSSVRNPNKGTYKGIRVYILSTPTHAQEYCPSLGSMTFIAAPSILYMPYFNVGSPNTREFPDYKFDLLTSASSAFTSIWFDFQVGY